MANKSKTLYEACQDIVKHSQHAKFNGLRVDLTSASVFVQVYDKLNEQNQARLAAIASKNPAMAIKLCYKLIK